MLRPAERVMAAAIIGVLVLPVFGPAAATEHPGLVLPPEVPHDEAARLRDIADRASVVGHVTGERFRLPATVFEYLLDHPEFAATLSRALTIATYRVWRDAGQHWLDDGRGAVGRFAFVHGAPGRRIVYARGRYTRWMIPIRGEAVAVLTWASHPAADGRALIEPTMTGFVRLDNVVADALARLLRRAATSRAEVMARRLVADFAAAARAIDTDPARVLETLRAHPDVRPADLDGFRRLVEARRGSATRP